MAPGTNRKRTLLSSGGDVAIPIANTTHAQQRIDPMTRNASRGRVRARTASKPRPTNHHAEREKKGNVTTAKDLVVNIAGWTLRCWATGPDIGPQIKTPGKLRFTTVGNCCSNTNPSEYPNERENGRRAFSFEVDLVCRTRAIDVCTAGTKTRVNHTKSSASGSKVARENFCGFKGRTDGSVPQSRVAIDT